MSYYTSGPKAGLNMGRLFITIDENSDEFEVMRFPKFEMPEHGISESPKITKFLKLSGTVFTSNRTYSSITSVNTMSETAGMHELRFLASKSVPLYKIRFELRDARSRLTRSTYRPNIGVLHISFKHNESTGTGTTMQKIQGFDSIDCARFKNRRLFSEIREFLRASWIDAAGTIFE